MLTQAQAAHYCGMGVKAFKATCPVSATQLRDGLRRFDRYKLDQWLDSLAPDNGTPLPIDWLSKLYPNGDDEGAQNGRQRHPTKRSEAVS
jgi:hypothetical protein